MGKCPSCGAAIYRNPAPVAVVLIPVGDGLLAVRRNDAPHIGELALPGGYIELDETWQQGGAREVFEETGLRLEPDTILDFRVLSAPADRVVLIFGLAPPLAGPPVLVANSEVSELVVIDAATPLAFPLHSLAVAQYFASRMA